MFNWNSIGKKRLLGFAYILAFLIIGNYFFLEVYSFNGNCIRKVYVDNVLVKAEEVKSANKIEKGLSGRDEIADGRGMLFVMPETNRLNFWMKGMLFPIDIIWIEGGKVIDCEKNISAKDPRIFTSPAPASRVLEVPAGFCDANGIKVNATVEIYSFFDWITQRLFS